MLRLQPKPKERRKERIPPDMVEAMREVWDLIQRARRDPDVHIDFDDAIQVGPLCGGRCGKEPRPFEFSYHPKHEGPRWVLTLSQYDLEDIADGRMTEITMYGCTTPGCGAMFNYSDGHCGCDYIRDRDFGHFDFPEAAEKLKQRGVEGISGDSNREDIVSQLGPPSESGGDLKTHGVYIWPWIKYLRDDCQLRFEFERSGRLRNITILKLDWKPGE